MWVVVMGQYLGSCQQTDWLQLKILGVISLWATAHKNGQFSDYTVRSHVYCGTQHTRQTAPDLRTSQMLSQYIRNVEIYELIRTLRQFIHKFEI
jgi:hypothetical protein